MIIERSEKELVQTVGMIISCNLPFSLLNFEIFRNFVKNLNQNYNMTTLRDLREQKINKYSK